MTRPKQIRMDAGVAQHVAATMAGVSPTTWKIFEANAEAVTASKRAACEAVLVQLAEKARAKTTAA